jgi:hypothetical protein
MAKKSSPIMKNCAKTTQKHFTYHCIQISLTPAIILHGLDNLSELLARSIFARISIN